MQRKWKGDSVLLQKCNLLLRTKSSYPRLKITGKKIIKRYIDIYIYINIEEIIKVRKLLLLPSLPKAIWAAEHKSSWCMGEYNYTQSSLSTGEYHRWGSADSAATPAIGQTHSPARDIRTLSGEQQLHSGGVECWKGCTTITLPQP